MDHVSLATLHTCRSLTDSVWEKLVTAHPLATEVTYGWLQETLSDTKRISTLWEEYQRADRGSIGETLRRHEVAIVTLHDDAYPALLREGLSPPPLLYIRGSVKAVGRGGVAIVGARKATAYGKHVSAAIAKSLAPLGVPVISGLAYGVDAAAHIACVEAGGITVAVFGCDVTRIYPSDHYGLATKILATGGALVSEFPLHAIPEAYHFPRRNRIIAGLAQAVVIVEAAERSGAMITAKYAMDSNRDLYAVPGPITSPLSAGPNSWLKLGATPLLSVDELAEHFGAARIPTTIDQLTPDEEKIINLLASGAQHIDDISESCTLDASVTAALLAKLELRGRVASAGPMMYGVVS